MSSSSSSSSSRPRSSSRSTANTTARLLTCSTTSSKTDAAPSTPTSDVSISCRAQCDVSIFGSAQCDVSTFDSAQYDATFDQINNLSPKISIQSSANEGALSEPEQYSNYKEASASTTNASISIVQNTLTEGASDTISILFSMAITICTIKRFLPGHVNRSILPAGITRLIFKLKRTGTGNIQLLQDAHLCSQ
mmetsp:Transcript_30797/g.48283  ORF Transcript_30797/g.48283 Transcript_30797/m.48283 type:complete len:193 (+) Transcript_30797:1080-1658(+)